MTKAELVDRLAKRSEKTKKYAAEALELVFGAIKDVLVEGKGTQQISIPGFGKFSVVKRAKRTGINPRTKKKIHIKATKAPKFTAAKALKASVK
jgi:DNA-binding protein HU-beta